MMTLDLPLRSEADFIGASREVFCCPRCAGTLERGTDAVLCTQCGRAYAMIDDIPRMFVPNQWEDTQDDVTDRMRQFYEETPFPNYDDFDSAGSLVEKARKGLFAKLLDDQIPIGARVLEAGCGTGQLTAFLSIANRTCVGADMCLNSLTMAKRFRDANRLRSAHFMQMNLFGPASGRRRSTSSSPTASFITRAIPSSPTRRSRSSCAPVGISSSASITATAGSPPMRDACCST